MSWTFSAMRAVEERATLHRFQSNAIRNHAHCSAWTNIITGTTCFDFEKVLREYATFSCEKILLWEWIAYFFGHLYCSRKRTKEWCCFVLQKGTESSRRCWMNCQSIDYGRINRSLAIVAYTRIRLFAGCSLAWRLRAQFHWIFRKLTIVESRIPKSLDFRSYRFIR